MKQQWVEYSLKTNSMKKFLLVFSAILTATIAQAQTDASVMLSIDNAVVVPSTSSSAADYSYLATLPSGENIITHQISAVGGERLINVKKIILKSKLNDSPFFSYILSQASNLNFDNLSLSITPLPK